MSNNINSIAAGKDAVQSQGTYTGDCIAAKVVLNANIATQTLGNSLMIIFSSMATELANVQMRIQNQMSRIQAALWGEGGENSMANIQKIIDSGQKLSPEQQSAIGIYTTKLGVAQSAIQAGVKAIDPVLTPTQNMPNALATSMKQQMDSCSTVIDGMKFLAQCRIA
jgi:hypothetical protein